MAIANSLGCRAAREGGRSVGEVSWKIGAVGARSDGSADRGPTNAGGTAGDVLDAWEATVEFRLTAVDFDVRTGSWRAPVAVMTARLGDSVLVGREGDLPVAIDPIDPGGSAPLGAVGIRHRSQRMAQASRRPGLCFGRPGRHSGQGRRRRPDRGTTRGGANGFRQTSRMASRHCFRADVARGCRPETTNSAQCRHGPAQAGPESGLRLGSPPADRGDEPRIRICPRRRRLLAGPRALQSGSKSGQLTARRHLGPDRTTLNEWNRTPPAIMLPWAKSEFCRT